MSSSFFSDLNEEKPKASPKGEKNSFFSDIPSKTRSLLSALPKGLIKGAQKFSPLPSFGPVPEKLGERVTEQFLPTQEGATEDILQFAGENIPLALVGEGGLAKKGLQALTGGLAKKGAKELNFPEWAQDVSSGLGMIGPSIAKAGVSRALKPSKKQSEMVGFLRSKGLTDKEITPIIQNKKKLSFLQHGAAKYEKKDPWFRGIKEKLGKVYDDVRNQGRESGYLRGPQLAQFEEDFNAHLDKVPRMYKKLIKSEIDDLFSNPIDFTELHDFNKAINAIVGSVEGGKAAVGVMKKPIETAQKNLSPSLYQDLQKTNQAYSKLNTFVDKMTKKNWEGLLKVGQASQALLGMLTLNPAMIAAGAKLAGITSLGRYGLKQILINPRLQNMHSKMWEAFLKNKIPKTLRLMNLIDKEAKKEENS